jgi:AbrB family looped-hinge helix DNA binding protein
MINVNSSPNHWKFKDVEISIKLAGTTLVWPKWRVVIPKEIRKEFSIEEWDNIMFFYNKDINYISVIKSSDFVQHINYINEEWIKLNII